MAIYRRERSTRLLVIGLVLTSLVIISVDFRGGASGPLAAMGRLTSAVIAPLQEGIARAFRPVGSFFGDLTRVGSIKAENAELRQRLEELQGDMGRFLELEAEVKELRALLEITDPLDYETVGATVISESVSNFEWAVYIDRGADDGIQVDMPVVAAHGLAGRVVEVTGGQAKVMLITDPGSSVAARLATTRETGILRGNREQDLVFQLVDAEVPVQPGEPVVTSGLGGIYPGGIPVGEVSQVIPEGADRTILVRPEVDFSRLGAVAVVLSEPAPAPDPGERVDG